MWSPENRKSWKTMRRKTALAVPKVRSSFCCGEAILRFSLSRESFARDSRRNEPAGRLPGLWRGSDDRCGVVKKKPVACQRCIKPFPRLIPAMSLSLMSFGVLWVRRKILSGCGSHCLGELGKSSPGHSDLVIGGAAGSFAMQYPIRLHVAPHTAIFGTPTMRYSRTTLPWESKPGKRPMSKESMGRYAITSKDLPAKRLHSPSLKHIWKMHSLFSSTSITQRI